MSANVFSTGRSQRIGYKSALRTNRAMCWLCCNNQSGADFATIYMVSINIALLYVVSAKVVATEPNAR